MLTLPALKLGSSGPEVRNWQRFLNQTASTGLSADGAFGRKTDGATRSWQAAHRLAADGVVGRLTRSAAVPLGFIQFLQARNVTRTSGRAIELIVFHDMEYPEKPEGAEWCAEFFSGPSAPRASAHYSCDANSIVQCVEDKDCAWHAPFANHNGIGIEHAGYAKQSRTEWLDAYSRAELALSARLVARLCLTYAIPILRVDADGLKAKKLGITGHRDVSQAFGGTHWDPGPSFAWDYYLDLVQTAADRIGGP